MLALCSTWRRWTHPPAHGWGKVELASKSTECALRSEKNTRRPRFPLKRHALSSATNLRPRRRRCLATCCSGKRVIGAARQAVPLSLRRRAHLRDGEPLLCLVVPCGLLLLGHCNCSMELQWRLAKSIIECVSLAGSSFASVFGALAGPRSHRSACHFCKDLAFWSLKTRKFFWPAGACHRGRRVTLLSLRAP